MPGKTGHLSVPINGKATIHLIFLGEHTVRPCSPFCTDNFDFLASSAFNYILSCDGAKKKHSVLTSLHHSICGPQARWKKKEARDTLALSAKGFALCTPLMRGCQSGHC